MGFWSISRDRLTIKQSEHKSGEHGVSRGMKKSKEREKEREGGGVELITCQLCAGTEVRLELAFGGREVSPRNRTTERDSKIEGTI